MRYAYSWWRSDLRYNVIMLLKLMTAQTSINWKLYNQFECEHWTRISVYWARAFSALCVLVFPPARSPFHSSAIRLSIARILFLAFWYNARVSNALISDWKHRTVYISVTLGEANEKKIYNSKIPNDKWQIRLKMKKKTPILSHL